MRRGGHEGSHPQVQYKFIIVEFSFKCFKSWSKLKETKRAFSQIKFNGEVSSDSTYRCKDLVFFNVVVLFFDIITSV